MWILRNMLFSSVTDTFSLFLHQKVILSWYNELHFRVLYLGDIYSPLMINLSHNPEYIVYACYISFRLSQILNKTNEPFLPRDYVTYLTFLSSYLFYCEYCYIETVFFITYFLFIYFCLPFQMMLKVKDCIYICMMLLGIISGNIKGHCQVMFLLAGKKCWDLFHYIRIP